MDKEERKRLLDKFQDEHESNMSRIALFKLWGFKTIWAAIRIMTIVMKIVAIMVLYMYFFVD